MRASRYNTAVEVSGGRTAVHNGLSGRLVVLARDEWARVERFSAGEDGGEGIEDRLEELVRHRFLTADDVDELAVLRARYQASRHGGPLGLTIVTSAGCNFDCPYCFEDKRPSKLKREVADALVQLVDDSPDTLPGVTVTWMGGEPLLGLDSLLELSHRLIGRCEARSIPYRASLVTNGWHLDEQTSVALRAARVGRAQVTVDGPADVHDRYRPLRNGGSTYERVVANLVAASHHLDIVVRVNLDRGNLGRAEELLGDLAARGAAARVHVVPARMTDVVANPDSPVASYTGSCFSAAEFGVVELEFERLAARHGFATRPSPSPTATPCTAVRATDVVVGADGQVWKCWDDIGNDALAIGTIFDYRNLDAEGLAPWLTYDPFSDPHCRSCVALPGCMGGCAHHLFHSGDPAERCGSFRSNHRERVRLHAEASLGLDVTAVDLPTIAACAASAGSVPPAASAVAGVVLGATRRRSVLGTA